MMLPLLSCLALVAVEPAEEISTADRLRAEVELLSKTRALANVSED